MAGEMAGGRILESRVSTFNVALSSLAVSCDEYKGLRSSGNMNRMISISHNRGRLF